ncbi:hypothetical protein J1614_003319 [Plenodomus biglobosus]|nr:hypothetical protein J1614_003319 [Plenodomus biglobosus]
MHPESRHQTGQKTLLPASTAGYVRVSQCFPADNPTTSTEDAGEGPSASQLECWKSGTWPIPTPEWRLGRVRKKSLRRNFQRIVKFLLPPENAMQPLSTQRQTLGTRSGAAADQAPRSYAIRGEQKGGGRSGLCLATVLAVLAQQYRRCRDWRG